MFLRVRIKNTKSTDFALVVDREIGGCQFKKDVLVPWGTENAKVHILRIRFKCQVYGGRCS